jgi:hypothetical protein
MTVSANPCAGIVERLYVQADSCDTYYLCENSVATKLRCPNGFSFDFSLQACNYGNLENCNDPCFGVSNSRFVARQTAGCGAYYVCQNGIGSPGNCPNGLYFDYEQQACNYPDNIVCAPNAPTVPPTPPIVSTTTETTTTTPVPGPCAGFAFGTFIPYPPYGCGGWQQCKNDISIGVGKCPTGLYFSFQGQSCEFPEYVKCYIPEL